MQYSIDLTMNSEKIPFFNHENISKHLELQNSSNPIENLDQLLNVIKEKYLQKDHIITDLIINGSENIELSKNLLESKNLTLIKQIDLVTKNKFTLAFEGMYTSHKLCDDAIIQINLIKENYFTANLMEFEKNVINLVDILSFFLDLANNSHAILVQKHQDKIENIYSFQENNKQILEVLKLILVEKEKNNIVLVVENLDKKLKEQLLNWKTQIEKVLKIIENNEK